MFQMMKEIKGSEPTENLCTYDAIHTFQKDRQKILPG